MKSQSKISSCLLGTDLEPRSKQLSLITAPSAQLYGLLHPKMERPRSVPRFNIGIEHTGEEKYTVSPYSASSVAISNRTFDNHFIGHGPEMDRPKTPRVQGEKEGLQKLQRKSAGMESKGQRNQMLASKMQSDQSKSNRSKTKRKLDKKPVSNEKKGAKKLSDLTRLQALSKPRELKVS